MAIPNILGGIQYGAAPQALMQTASGLQGLQAGQQKLQANEQQMEINQQMRDAAGRYAQGDKSALIDMFKASPKMGLAFQQLEDQRIERVGAQKNNEIKRETAAFLQRVRNTPKEQWGELADEALANDMIDFDGARAQALRDGNEFVVDAGLINFIGPDNYKALYGGQGKEDTTSQADFNYYQQLKERDPEAARAFGMAKGYVETGRDAAPTTEQRNWKEYQRLKKENPEEAKQYGQAAGFISKEGRELSVAMQKRLSDATDTAVKAGADVVKYNDLASQIDDASIEGGWSGRAGEFLKEVTGNQDFKTELRRDYYAIRGAEVVNNLPPGAASDADIAMAMAGFPNENASGEQIASFLRGLAKIKKFDKQYNEFKANYLSENGTERGMLNAWKEEGVEFMTPQRTIGKYQVQEVN